MTKEEFLKLYTEHSEASVVQEVPLEGSSEGEAVQVVLKSDGKLFQADCYKSFKDGTDNPNSYSLSKEPVEVYKSFIALPLYTSTKSNHSYYVAMTNNGETVIGVFLSEESAGKWVFDNVIKEMFEVTEEELKTRKDGVTPENAWNFYDCDASVREIEVV